MMKACSMWQVAALLLVGASIAARAMDVRLQVYVTPGSTNLPAASVVNCLLLNNSLALTGDSSQFRTSLVGSTFDSTNQIYYCDLPNADFHNYQIVNGASANPLPATKVTVKYNQASGGCAAGAEVVLANGPAGQTLNRLAPYGWWQYKAGGYASSYTQFPVKFDVDFCQPGTVMVTLTRVDGSTISATTTFSSTTGLVSTTSVLNAGTNNQIRSLKVAYTPAQPTNTCRLARARVETQTTPANDPTKPNYTCFYRTHPLNALLVHTPGYVASDPSTYVLMSSTLPYVEIACSINSNFC